MASKKQRKTHPVTIISTEVLLDLTEKAQLLALADEQTFGADKQLNLLALRANVDEVCEQFKKELVAINEAYRQGRSIDLVELLDDLLELTSQPEIFQQKCWPQLVSGIRELLPRMAKLRQEIGKVIDRDDGDRQDCEEMPNWK